MRNKLFFAMGLLTSILCIYATTGNSESRKQNEKSEPVVLASFTEEEDFKTSEKFANSLGYASITIQAGEYQILENPDGTIVATLDLKDFVDDDVRGDYDDESKDGFGEAIVGIRIAKRICKRHGKPCHCGIGFRCGVVVTNPVYEDGNPVLELRVGVDQANNKIRFLLPAETDVRALMDEE